MKKISITVYYSRGIHHGEKVYEFNDRNLDLAMRYGNAKKKQGFEVNVKIR